MERFIARANIERFRRLLAEEIDEISRTTLLDLLAKEERKLARLNDLAPERPKGQSDA